MSKVFEEGFYTDDFDQEMVDYLFNNGWIVCGNTPNNTPSISQPYLKYGCVNKHFWTSEQETSYYIKLTKQEFKEKIGMVTGYKLADGSYSGQYKIGDKFEATDGAVFSKGAIVTYCRDDNTDSPYFIDSTGGSWCCFWWRLKPYKVPAKQFTKSDLRDGMICTSRCGYIYTVQGDRIVRGGWIISLESIAEDLTVDGAGHGKWRPAGDLDIVKVEQPIVLFTREEPPVKSPAQIELEKLQEQIAALQEQANKLQGVIE